MQASTIARALGTGSSDLKIPLPTKTPSQPSSMVSITSAGVLIPPAANVTTGNLPNYLISFTNSIETYYSLANKKISS